MIVPGTRFAVAEVPIERIVVTETGQPRYPDRVNHYVRLLSDPAHQDDFAGLVHLAPYGMHAKDRGAMPRRMYTLLDGHHRFIASVISGRKTVLALILVEPGWPEYDTFDCSLWDIRDVRDLETTWAR